MPLTRGGLQPATLKNMTTEEVVHFMFNPEKYLVSKTNQFTPGNGDTGKDVPHIHFQQGQGRNTTLTLWFDTFDTGPNPTPVTSYTSKLWAMMKVDDGKRAPAIVKFEWGAISLLAVIERLEEEFSLFTPSGVPVRSKVTATLVEIPDDGTGIAPSEGTAATTPGNSMHDQAARAHQSYRPLAERNNVDNPLRVPNGTLLN